jgi:hypothetical protein
VEVLLALIRQMQLIEQVLLAEPLAQLSKVPQLLLRAPDLVGPLGAADGAGEQECERQEKHPTRLKNTVECRSRHGGRDSSPYFSPRFRVRTI